MQCRNNEIRIALTFLILKFFKKIFNILVLHIIWGVCSQKYLNFKNFQLNFFFNFYGYYKICTVFILLKFQATYIFRYIKNLKINLCNI
jgi:hypothetical protein